MTAQKTADQKPDPHYAGHRDRLRQRFLDSGPDALADYELLELILFGAIPRRDVKPLAKDLIAKFGSFGDVLMADPDRLATDGGLGRPAVAAIKAAAASSTRMLRQQAIGKPVLGSWQSVMDYLRVAIGFSKTEQFHLLFLDSKNALIADEKQQEGTVNHAPVYPREVIRRALELHATSIIMVHNHPSGSADPSKADIAMTREVEKAAQAVGIALHDHVIIGKKDHSSMRSLGLLGP